MKLSKKLSFKKVIDQYTGKKWGNSVIYDKGTATTSSYNSQLYYVIV